MSRKVRIIFLVILAIVAGNFLAQSFMGYKNYKKTEEINYTQFQNKLENNEVESINIVEKQNTQMIFEVTPKNEEKVLYKVIIPNRGEFFSTITDRIEEKGVEISFSEKEDPSFLANLVLGLLPVLLIIGFLVWFSKSGKAGNSGLFNMFKHKAYLVDSEVKFSDVAGNEETIQEVREIVDFLNNPQKYLEVGASIPKGVLMAGPPGTGKTLLAKAVAGEAKVPFFTTSGSEFVEVFAGLGAGRIRELFKEARSSAPCIIFIDELDAIGKSRSQRMESNGEREQTLNQLLVEMDGISTVDKPIIIMAATNRAEILDNALVRPGRFDRQVNVGLPDVSSREKILKIHARKIKMAKNVLLAKIAKSTAGFSGADLANLCNEAALLAAREGSKEVFRKHFDEAIDKILMGVKHMGLQMDEKEKSLTAYHEAGHAIIGWLKDAAEMHDPVHKVSIIPRGRALGVTVYQPEKDKVSINKQEIKAQICSLFGGRVAEELINGDALITTGASNDIERATQLAYSYVTRWGLDSDMGPIYYGKHETYVDGRERLISEETIQKIENSVKSLIDECYKEAKEIVTSNKDKLELMHDTLIEYETIESETVDSIMSGTYVLKRKSLLLDSIDDDIVDDIDDPYSMKV